MKAAINVKSAGEKSPASFVSDGDALSKLPPLEEAKGKRFHFLKSIKPTLQLIANPPAKAVFTVPKMKQVAKLAESLGKKVTSLTVNGDGSFTVAVADPFTDPAKNPNPWDEELS